MTTRISAFPQFTALGAATRHEYEAAVAGIGVVSDLAYPTLMAWWTHRGDMLVARCGSSLVLRYAAPGVNEPIGTAVVGRGDVSAAIDSVMAHLGEREPAPELQMIPGIVAAGIDPRSYCVGPQRSYDEYLLSVDDLATLHGAAHGRTRRKVRRFLREASGAVSVRPVDLAPAGVRDAVRSRADAWRAGSVNDPRGEERAALARSLSDDLCPDFRGLEIRCGSEPCAYAVYQPPRDGHVIVNHLLTDPAFVHIDDFAIHALAASLQSERVGLMNIEMDLGIPGLRTHKERLRPVGYVRKYCVRPLGRGLR